MTDRERWYREQAEMFGEEVAAYLRAIRPRPDMEEYDDLSAGATHNARLAAHFASIALEYAYVCDCDGGEQGDGMCAVPHEPHCRMLQRGW